jgi:hypothetical protein
MLIYLEPSVLSFDPFRIINDYSHSPEREFSDFKSFIENLEMVLQEMEIKGYKISVSKEFWETIKESIPVSVYGADTRYHLANELLVIKLPRFIRKTHKYGDHNIEGQFENGTFSKNEILGNNTYLLWLDLLLANFNNLYPKSILKSSLLKVYNVKKIVAIAEGMRLVYDLHDNLEQLCNSKEVTKFELKDTVKNEPTIANVPCHGTGDHDSMWGVKINDIGDIPLFERELFNKLLLTKLVHKIVFLNFDNQAAVVNSPVIKIIEIEENDHHDSLHCEILGKGVKQNSQKISILVKKGMGKKLKMGSEGLINHDFLDCILE